MKFLLILLAALTLNAGGVTISAPSTAVVTYRLLNSATVPESGLSPTAPTIGVLVFVRFTDPETAKMDIQIVYVGEDGAQHSATKSLTRPMGRGGHSPLPIPALFSGQILELRDISVRTFVAHE